MGLLIQRLILKINKLGNIILFCMEILNRESDNLETSIANLSTALPKFLLVTCPKNGRGTDEGSAEFMATKNLFIFVIFPKLFPSLNRLFLKRSKLFKLTWSRKTFRTAITLLRKLLTPNLIPTTTFTLQIRTQKNF